jgi:hypothetical protein
LLIDSTQKQVGIGIGLSTGRSALLDLPCTTLDIAGKTNESPRKPIDRMGNVSGRLRNKIISQDVSRLKNRYAWGTAHASAAA